MAPLELPAAAGLGLPRLTGVPDRYPVFTDVREGAALALGLLEAGIIDADDAKQDDDPTSFVVRSLTRLWLPKRLERFDYAYTLAPFDDGLYFSIGLEGGYAFDFSAAAAACDAVDLQLGPSLLTQLRLHTPLTPAFTPEVCRDYLAAFYWEGSDDAENLLYLARDDLAYAQGVDEALLDPAEVAAYADSHYFTPRRVDALLERRYTDTGSLTLNECLSLCRDYARPNLTRVCELLYALRALAERLPMASRDVFEAASGSEPFAALVTLPRAGAEDDLVREVYREYESSVWQEGDFSPVYALEIKPADPASLNRFKNALAVAKRSLELTDELYRILEVTTCLFP